LLLLLRNNIIETFINIKYHKITMEKSNKLKRRIENIAIGLAFLGSCALCTHRTASNYSPFTEQDFKNAKWYSSTATPNEAYNFEKIPHNQMVRNFYFQQVEEKNGSLVNARLFPDLDGDGKVLK
jgi:hypothetical protein